MAVRIFPALIIVYDLSNARPKELERRPLPFVGPVKDFTVQLNLEHSYISVWGHAQGGFFRYHIHAAEGSFTISDLPPKQQVNVAERLSLGVDKKQDWNEVARRLDLAEILPFWLRLGSLVPAVKRGEGGVLTLLKHETLQECYMAGFEGILFPRLEDADYQGFGLPAVADDQSPIALLTQGADLIRSLFFHHDGPFLSILPQLPHAFDAGRFVNVSCGNVGEVDFEWRSRKLRRLVFRCQQDAECSFVVPKNLKTFRLRTACNERGIIHENGKPHQFAAGTTYYLDCFES